MRKMKTYNSFNPLTPPSSDDVESLDSLAESFAEKLSSSPVSEIDRKAFEDLYNKITQSRQSAPSQGGADNAQTTKERAVEELGETGAWVTTHEWVDPAGNTQWVSQNLNDRLNSLRQEERQNIYTNAVNQPSVQIHINIPWTQKWRMVSGQIGVFRRGHKGRAFIEAAYGINEVPTLPISEGGRRLKL